MATLRHAVLAVAISVGLASLSVPLSGQGENRQAAARPWPPAKTVDGQPNVEGAWRPVSGGTHSLDPALSNAQEFDQRISGVIKRNPSFVVDPPNGHIPYQPWAVALYRGAARPTESRSGHVACGR